MHYGGPQIPVYVLPVQPAYIPIDYSQNMGGIPQPQATTFNYQPPSTIVMAPATQYPDINGFSQQGIYPSANIVPGAGPAFSVAHQEPSQLPVSAGGNLPSSHDNDDAKSISSVDDFEARLAALKRM